MAGAIFYEVALDIDPEIAPAFDEWLKPHVEAMLQLPGFEGVELLHPAEQGSTVRRLVRYRLTDRTALETYLESHAAQMRQDAVDRFGDRFRATRRVLTPDQTLAGPAVTTSPPSCLNCGAPLAGQYCAQCGQRARVRLITLWELVRDVVGDLFELDSRLWRSLIPLVIRPGRLTRDYLAGRRVYYMPPFRMYLVLSLIFFVLWSFAEDGESGLQVSLGDSGEIDQLSIRIPDDPEAQAELEQELGELREQLEVAAEEDHPLTAEDCQQIREWPLGPLEERFIRACEKIAADHGQSLGKALIDNIPTMLFLFLPVLALLQKLLYIRSGRYYVEHLLFFIHLHSFFFLVGILYIFAAGLAVSAPVMDRPVTLLGAVIWTYAPFVYPFVAMRRVYEQGRFVTLLKYTVLGLGYIVTLVATLLITLAFVALTL